MGVSIDSGSSLSLADQLDLVRNESLYSGRLKTLAAAEKSAAARIAVAGDADKIVELRAEADRQVAETAAARKAGALEVKRLNDAAQERLAVAETEAKRIRDEAKAEADKLIKDLEAVNATAEAEVSRKRAANDAERARLTKWAAELDVREDAVTKAVTEAAESKDKYDAKLAEIHRITG